MTPVKIDQQYGHKLSLKIWFGLKFYRSFLPRAFFFFLCCYENIERCSFEPFFLVLQITEC